MVGRRKFFRSAAFSCQAKFISRYASCGQLADDLRRWLEGEQIRARRLGPAERAWRWYRRNPVVAGLALAAVLSLVLGMVLSSFFALQANARARDALQERQRTADKADEAGANARRADQKAAEAQANAQRVREGKRVSDRRLYAAHLNLAQRAWEEGELGRFLELLKGQRPEQTGGEELRGFEWYYWWRRYHSQLLTFEGEARCVAFSPDGTRLAGAGDREVRVWDARAGQQLLSVPGKDCVAFSPDGKRLASASSDQTVKVWDARTGQELLTLQEHTGPVKGVAFSPDGKRLASASQDRTVKVWDLERRP